MFELIDDQVNVFECGVHSHGWGLLGWWSEIKSTAPTLYVVQHQLLMGPGPGGIEPASSSILICDGNDASLALFDLCTWVIYLCRRSLERE